MNVIHYCRHWTRREEADFYRIVSTFGVERDCETGQFIWDKFRVLARLERKLDNTLTEYFRAFYHMCMKVCRRFASEEDGKYLPYLFMPKVQINYYYYYYYYRIYIAHKGASSSQVAGIAI